MTLFPHACLCTNYKTDTESQMVLLLRHVYNRPSSSPQGPITLSLYYFCSLCDCECFLLKLMKKHTKWPLSLKHSYSFIAQCVLQLRTGLFKHHSNERKLVHRRKMFHILILFVVYWLDMDHSTENQPSGFKRALSSTAELSFQLTLCGKM